MVYKSTLILVLPICYGLLAGNKYLSHCQRTVVYLVLSEYGSPFVCFHRRYDGCNYRGNNMHGYSVAALRIRQQKPSIFCACNHHSSCLQLNESSPKCAETFLFQSSGQNQIKSFPPVPVVFTWQEGRLNFCLSRA